MHRGWDFNMFQSGHRRYGQRKGDGDYTIAENTEEDNWRYAETGTVVGHCKTVIDGEPSYEDIPLRGLHEANETRWTAKRRATLCLLVGFCRIIRTYLRNTTPSCSFTNPA